MSQPIPCDVCKGDRHIPTAYDASIDQLIYEDCPQCLGSGFVDSDPDGYGEEDGNEAPLEDHL